MKGHVKIELIDRRTGRLIKTERDNMLTNALAYRAGIDSNDTLSRTPMRTALCPWEPRDWEGF